ncbi:MAG TPA: Coq4 family protein [Caulobacteraceae bacterium]|jgi:ubiquinone biosynthesis protein COQ4|nr:Coq4 family protein [Caulobacteraceae bacterium]
MAMTDTLTPPLADAPRAPAPALGPDGTLPRPKRNWVVAFKALRRLLRDKEDTGQVFEIMGALNGDSTARNYERLMRTPGGGRLASEQVELAPLMMDDAWLDSFAPGAVGAAYRDFVRSENISAEGLAEISRKREQGRGEIQHPYAWFGRRIRDSHDIWHILSGYHRDGLGEACLVAFSYGQTGSLGWAFIALGAALRSRGPGGRMARKAIWQGYQRGKAAKWFPGQDYVRLLSEPLDAARQRLRITPATIYDAIPRDMRG